MLPRFGRKFDQIQRKTVDRGLAQRINPGDVGTPGLHVFQNLHHFIVVVMLEVELKG